MPRYQRLSSRLEDLQAHYPVVVVGSGYGGGITASRLARAGQRVCVLERGKERQPGEYPQTELEVVPEIQAELAGRRLPYRNGLYDVRMFEQIGMLVGCGLGGTSLINAGVAIEPDPRVFQDPRWPAALRDDMVELAAGFARARAMLRPDKLPDAVTPAKLRVLADSAAQINAPFQRAEINVTFQAQGGGVNHVGVEQPDCLLCGDCMTGCNHGAKNTTLMNYLPDAVNHGAEIFTEIEVRRIAQKPGGGYLVHYAYRGARLDPPDDDEPWLSADVVVLAAGTLGSTEILLRSRDRGLPVSPQLGHGFSGNGGVIGFGYNCEARVNAVGAGPRVEDLGRLSPGDRPGPCITSMIDLRAVGAAADDVDQGIIIEEGSSPGPLAGFLPLPLAVASGLLGEEADGDHGDSLRRRARVVDSLVRGPYHGAVEHTQTYLATGHERRLGTMVLVSDRVRVDWPEVGDEPIFRTINHQLLEATRAPDGVFVRDPLWIEAFDNRLFTCHPLGGCAMADAADRGVVNHKGQVFAAPAGDAVHAGLYVADGAVLPRSLGCNPLLTISALAERTCALLARDRGWTIDEALPSRPRPHVRPRPPDTTGIEFSERLVGHVSTRVVDDCLRAEADGRARDSRFELEVTVVADDLQRLIHDETYEAAMIGSATAPALSGQPLAVTAGRLSLLVKDPTRIDTKILRYRIQLRSTDDRRYWLEGIKYLKDDPGPDLWSDVTTLFITVHAGTGPGGTVVGRGVLHIEPADLLGQLRSTRAINAATTAERLAAVAEFGAFIAGGLWSVYGGVARAVTAGRVASAGAGSPGKPAAPAARRKRVLRAPPPEVHDLTAGDGAVLRLTRYRGDHGPVVLAHGIAASSATFSLDTIDTNLVEYLVHKRYDVWLLDQRSSIELSAHRTQYTAADIARHDFPAAIARVRAATGAESVQVVAHCLGAMAFAMAMLAGLSGVRAAVLSQLAIHVHPPVATRLQRWLRVPELLGALGVTALDDARSGWRRRLLDGALSAWSPRDLRCGNSLCRRLALRHGRLYAHDQLNQATHDALHELFGATPASALAHLARTFRAGRVAGAESRDQLARFRIPTAFLHGADNAYVLPSSTLATVAALSRANGSDWYRHHVIPGYGHADCIVGKNAVADVYPLVLAHLDATR